MNYKKTKMDMNVLKKNEITINKLISIVSVLIIIAIPIYYLFESNKKENKISRMIPITEDRGLLKQSVTNKVAKILSDTAIAIKDLTVSNVGFLTGKQKIYYFKNDCEKLRGRFNSLRDKAQSAWDMLSKQIDTGIFNQKPILIQPELKEE